ncbi:MAG: alginate lyase, partial [Verrucomicrobiota bacterium]|nr:alginate lyase [Verrucomicrobiota bacterium]
MEKFLGLSLLLLFAGCTAAPESLPPLSAPSAPKIYSFHPDALAASRDRLARGDPALAPALERLRKDADHALKFKPVSVMDKPRVPPSGDKHDYLSQAPYWWPDPSKPDGL